MSYSVQHLRETTEIIAKLNPDDCEKCVAELVATRTRGGRLFILGVGGSAANASHAVNDFRKIAGLECYAPTDNVSELTARTNDEGWATVFVEWLRGSRLKAADTLLILSVGGGNLEKNVSPNLVLALKFAQEVGAHIIAIVGKDGGYAAKVAHACVIVPTVNPANITPHSEAFQAVIWHLFVSHPDLKMNQTKWESVTAKESKVGRTSVRFFYPLRSNPPSTRRPHAAFFIRPIRPIRPVRPLPDAPMPLRPAIFLDRDGTLNRQIVRDGQPYPPATLAEFELFPGVPAACATLAAAGYVLVVVTNQPDVGRGTQSAAVVESMHARLRSLVPSLAHLEVCYAPGQGLADPADYRRKPAPGMLLDAARTLHLDLTRSWMVGDRWRDIDCGQRAGVRTVFIDFGYTEALRAPPDFTVRSFPDAAAVILATRPAP